MGSLTVLSHMYMNNYVCIHIHAHVWRHICIWKYLFMCTHIEIHVHMRNDHLMILLFMATLQWWLKFSWLLRMQKLFSVSHSKVLNSVILLSLFIDELIWTVNDISSQKYMVLKALAVQECQEHVEGLIR